MSNIGGVPLLIPLSKVFTSITYVEYQKTWNNLVYVTLKSSFVLALTAFKESSKLLKSRKHGVLQYFRYTHIQVWKAELGNKQPRNVLLSWRVLGKPPNEDNSRGDSPSWLWTP